MTDIEMDFKRGVSNVMCTAKRRAFVAWDDFRRKVRFHWESVFGRKVPIQREGKYLLVPDFSHDMLFSANGTYLGQWQPDMLSEEIGAGDIWIPARDGAEEAWSLSERELRRGYVRRPR